MRESRNAIADHLLGLSAITSRISTFKGVPAIFSTSPIPPSAAGRYIVIRDAHVDDAFETKKPQDAPSDMAITAGRVVMHDVAVYEDQTGDSSVVEDVALLIREGLNRVLIPISGYGTLIAKAVGPVAAPESETVSQEVVGRIVTVELTVIKRP
jgi:hypothetical protein